MTHSSYDAATPDHVLYRKRDYGSADERRMALIELRRRHLEPTEEQIKLNRIQRVTKGIRTHQDRWGYV